MRYLSDGTETQILRCCDCKRRFSKNYIRHYKQKGIRQISVIPQEAKNLTNVAETKTVTGDMENKLKEYHLNMKINGYADATIHLSWSILEILVKRGANLQQPKTVKKVISEQKWSGNRKRNVINAYTQFLKYLGLTWNPPSYTLTRKIPFIPTEQEIDDLIAGCPNTVATFLQLLKETAMRCGEALRLKWKEVDLERRIITLNEPEKGSNPRIFSELSGKLLSMLNNLQRENEKLFGTRTRHSLKGTYIRARKRLAYKLGNPRLNEIHFHTLRHCKATMLYHYTKDLMLVAEFLGHKEIENTRLYIQLDKQLFQNIPDDKFIIRAAHTIEEATKLGEVGFEPYVIMEGVQLFRKRK
jgi:integrase